MAPTISYEEFAKVDIRVGRIVEIDEFPRSHKPAYRLKIDFGHEIGIKQSSAQFKSDYRPEDLMGRLCLAVINFEPKNIAGYMSEVLVLGVPREGGGLALVGPDAGAEPGGRLY